MMSTVSCRNFCGACDSLFWRNPRMLPGKLKIQPSTPGDPEAIAPVIHVQPAERLSWMGPGSKLPETDRFPD